MYCQIDLEYADDMCLVSDQRTNWKTCCRIWMRIAIRCVSPSVHGRQRSWQLVKSNNDKQLEKFSYNLQKSLSALWVSLSTLEALLC